MVVVFVSVVSMMKLCLRWEDFLFIAKSLVIKLFHRTKFTIRHWEDDCFVFDRVMRSCLRFFLCRMWQRIQNALPMNCILLQWKKIENQVLYALAFIYLIFQVNISVFVNMSECEVYLQCYFSSSYIEVTWLYWCCRLYFVRQKTIVRKNCPGRGSSRCIH